MHIQQNIISIKFALGAKNSEQIDTQAPFLTRLIKTRQIWGIWKLWPAYSPETPNLDTGKFYWLFLRYRMISDIHLEREGNIYRLVIGQLVTS